MLSHALVRAAREPFVWCACLTFSFEAFACASMKICINDCELDKESVAMYMLLLRWSMSVGAYHAVGLRSGADTVGVDASL